MARTKQTGRRATPGYSQPEEVHLFILYNNHLFGWQCKRPPVSTMTRGYKSARSLFGNELKSLCNDEFCLWLPFIKYIYHSTYPNTILESNYSMQIYQSCQILPKQEIPKYLTDIITSYCGFPKPSTNNNNNNINSILKDCINNNDHYNWPISSKIIDFDENDINSNIAIGKEKEKAKEKEKEKEKCFGQARCVYTRYKFVSDKNDQEILLTYQPYQRENILLITFDFDKNMIVIIITGIQCCCGNKTWKKLRFYETTFNNFSKLIENTTTCGIFWSLNDKFQDLFLIDKSFYHCQTCKECKSKFSKDNNDNDCQWITIKNNADDHDDNEWNVKHLLMQCRVSGNVSTKCNVKETGNTETTASCNNVIEQEIMPPPKKKRKIAKLNPAPN